MRCRYCDFPRVLGENIMKKEHVLRVITTYLCGSHCFFTGSLAELIPIGPLF
jgi:hypothetical protein